MPMFSAMENTQSSRARGWRREDSGVWRRSEEGGMEWREDGAEGGVGEGEGRVGGG